MADAITIQALQDASLDAKSLEEVVNGNESKQVTTRKGESYPSVKKAIKTLFENGGLPATPFATKALMTASALVDGDYAQVTDDTVNNGLYVKTAGAWVKSAYDPMTTQKLDSQNRFNTLYEQLGVDYIEIFSMIDLSDAIANGAKVGDVYFNSQLQGLYKINGINGTTGNASPVSFPPETVFLREGKLYLYNNGFTLASNEVIKNILSNEDSRYELNIIQLKSLYNLNDTIKRGATVGDYYYNASANPNGIYQITELNGAGGGSVKPVFFVNALYAYQGTLYTLKGTAIVKTTLSSESLFLGNRRLTESTPHEKIMAYANGLKFSDELKDYVSVLTKTGDKFSHTPSFVFHGDTCYALYMANFRGTGETPTQMIIRFASFEVSDPANINYYDICDIGDSVMGKAVIKNYDSAVFIKGDTIHILWNAVLEGETSYTMFHQTFNPITKVFSDIGTANFKVGATTLVMTGDNINNAFLAEKVAAPVFSEHIVLMTQVSTRVENGVTYYYTGIGATGSLNMIVKTTDFITWQYVAQPDFHNNAQFEPAVYVIGDYAYYYCRQAGELFGFLTRYHIPTNKWDAPIYISECQSRSQFFEYEGELYLMYAPRNRWHLGVIKIDRYKLQDSIIVQVARNDNQYAYPDIKVHNNKLYALFSSGRKGVYVSEFTIGGLTFTHVENKFRELLFV